MILVMAPEICHASISSSATCKPVKKAYKRGTIPKPSRHNLPDAHFGILYKDKFGFQNARKKFYTSCQPFKCLSKG